MSVNIISGRKCNHTPEVSQYLLHDIDPSKYDFYTNTSSISSVTKLVGNAVKYGFKLKITDKAFYSTDQALKGHVAVFVRKHEEQKKPSFHSYNPYDKFEHYYSELYKWTLSDFGVQAIRRLAERYGVMIRLVKQSETGLVTELFGKLKLGQELLISKDNHNNKVDLMKQDFENLYFPKCLMLSDSLYQARYIGLS